MVAEVYDTARLQQTFQKAVTQLDAELRANGKPGVKLTSQQAGGRTYYAIGSADGKLSISYLYEDGYMIAGPSRALLEQAIQLRDSGVTIATTAKFRDLLGPDGQVNVSALVYTNIAPMRSRPPRCCRAARATGTARAARGRSPRCSSGRDRRSTTPTRSRIASSSPAAIRTPWV